MSTVPLANGCSGYHYYTKEVVEKWNKNVISKKDENDNNTTERLQTAAIVSSWVSMIVSVTTGVAAIALGQVYNSQSLFGYGLDGVLDSLSSVVVLWRFYDSSSSAKIESRERRACIVISLLFLISAFSLIFKSVSAIDQFSVTDTSNALQQVRFLTIIFCSICGVLALCIATFKVVVGRKLSSRVLITDSIITYVGAAISFLGVTGMELYTKHEDVWYLDAVFGMCCGTFLLLYGLKLLADMTCLYQVKRIPGNDANITP